MNLLVVQTGFLGDVILSSALYPFLKDKYPNSNLTVLTTPAAKGLILNHPSVDEVITFDKRKSDSGFFGLLRVAKRLKAKKFQIVFSLHKSYRTSALLFLSGIKERYGFNKASARFLYSKTCDRQDLEHEVLRNLAILRNIDVDPKSIESKLNIGFSDAAQSEANQLLKKYSQKTLIGVCPGSVWTTKRWTEEGFSQLLEELDSKGYQSVLIGGPDDRKVADKITELSKSEPLDLVGKTSIEVSAAIVSKMNVVISNDSAPLHMASATGVPAVALFCATVPEFGYGPWGVPHEIVEIKGLDCRPCGRHGGHSCPTGTWDCMRKITADMVVSSCERLLQDKSRNYSL